MFSPHELKLVRGTYRVMARMGTQQLSLRRIARELGVSPALLVYHFGTRDNLLIETMRWVLVVGVRRIRRDISAIEDPEKALAALMDTVFVGARENRDFYLVYLDLVHFTVRRKSLGKLAGVLRDHANDTYAAVIRQGVEIGVFRVDDVRLAARRARAIVEGSFLQWLQEEDWEQTHARLRRNCHEALLLLLTGGAAR